MSQRGFEPEDVRKVLEKGTVIEDYSNDFPYPSCLVLGWFFSRPVYVVAAMNNDDQETVIITVYEPDLQLWENDFTRRKT
jgi:hypothetical protein